MEKNWYNTYNHLTKYLLRNNCIKDDFFLIDIGASGGILSNFNVFRPKLQALGIDIMKSECIRLNNNEQNKKIKYVQAKVGLKEDHKFVIEKIKNGGINLHNSYFPRTSAAQYTQLNANKCMGEYKKDLNNWNQQSIMVQEIKTVDDIVKEEKWNNTDFIKVDIDGNDVEAILSCEEILKAHTVLGFMLEVNFQGTTCSTDHTFANTDTIMRKKGFDIFDLSVRRYSSSKLPAPWAVSGCQTASGRIVQGDALYLLDPCCIDNKSKPSLSIDKILKLACLYEIFGKPDHSAELLIHYKEILLPKIDVVNLLNILTRQICPKFTKYEDYISAFKKNPKTFYL